MIIKCKWHVLLSLCCLAGLVIYAFLSVPETPQQGLRVVPLTIVTANGHEVHYTVEVAEKPMDLQMGLMYRKEMAPDHGMLFVMSKEPKETSFWMKNTYIPLDIIFIEKDGRIGHIHKGAVPHDLTPIPSVVPVTHVLELNAGEADRRHIAVGDRAKFMPGQRSF